jgi:hypothetical protein
VIIFAPAWGCSSAGEHRVRNAGVEGSNPFISTRNENEIGKFQ